MRPWRRGIRVGLIELGTNSTKLLITDVSPRGTRRTRHFSTQVTRIGRGLGTSGRISQAGLAATLEALRDFSKTARRERVEEMFAFATFAFREAKNAQSTAHRIGRELGVPLRILSGREEAEFVYLSARTELRLSKPDTLLIDIGGGSTEMVLARNRRVQYARSLRLGALYLTERFISSDPIDAREFDRLETHVANSISNALRRAQPRGATPARLDLVASGGSIMTSASVIAGTSRRRPRAVIQLGEISALLDRCLAVPLSARRRIRGLEPERADIIPAGLAVARAVMRQAHKRTLAANAAGVRGGVLAHLIENDFEW